MIVSDACVIRATMCSHSCRSCVEHLLIFSTLSLCLWLSKLLYCTVCCWPHLLHFHLNCSRFQRTRRLEFCLLGLFFCFRPMGKRRGISRRLLSRRCPSSRVYRGGEGGVVTFTSSRQLIGPILFGVCVALPTSPLSCSSGETLSFRLAERKFFFFRDCHVFVADKKRKILEMKIDRAAIFLASKDTPNIWAALIFLSFRLTVCRTRPWSPPR